MSAIRNTSLPLAGAVGAIGLTVAFTAKKRFVARLDALDERLANVQGQPQARTDLPSAVKAIARLSGVSDEHPTQYVDLRQTGTMWFKPGGTSQSFTARQRNGTSSSGFVWRAKIGPLGAMSVVDSFVDDCGFLEARLFNVFPMARIDGTADLNQGEALRYLAELPLNPDAMLFDHALEWFVNDEQSITVATGTGASRAEIVFGLDDAGLIRTASAVSRVYGQTGKSYPWHGRFWDYQETNGRLIPMQAEVAWVIDGKDFIYWRGEIESWIPVMAKTVAR